MLLFGFGYTETFWVNMVRGYGILEVFGVVSRPPPSILTSKSVYLVNARMQRSVEIDSS
jgi:hypothetical protein